MSKNTQFNTGSVTLMESKDEDISANAFNANEIIIQHGSERPDWLNAGPYLTVININSIDNLTCFANTKIAIPIKIQLTFLGGELGSKLFVIEPGNVLEQLVTTYEEELLPLITQHLNSIEKTYFVEQMVEDGKFELIKKLGLAEFDIMGTDAEMTNFLAQKIEQIAESIPLMDSKKIKNTLNQIHFSELTDKIKEDAISKAFISSIPDVYKDFFASSDKEAYINATSNFFEELELKSDNEREYSELSYLYTALLRYGYSIDDFDTAKEIIKFNQKLEHPRPIEEMFYNMIHDNIENVYNLEKIWHTYQTLTEFGLEKDAYSNFIKGYEHIITKQLCNDVDALEFVIDKIEPAYLPVFLINFANRLLEAYSYGTENKHLQNEISNAKIASIIKSALPIIETLSAPQNLQSEDLQGEDLQDGNFYKAELSNIIYKLKHNQDTPDNIASAIKELIQTGLRHNIFEYPPHSGDHLRFITAGDEELFWHLVAQLPDLNLMQQAINPVYNKELAQDLSPKALESLCKRLDSCHPELVTSYKKNLLSELLNKANNHTNRDSIDVKINLIKMIDDDFFDLSTVSSYDAGQLFTVNIEFFWKYFSRIDNVATQKNTINNILHHVTTTTNNEPDWQTSILKLKDLLEEQYPDYILEFKKTLFDKLLDGATDNSNASRQKDAAAFLLELFDSKFFTGGDFNYYNMEKATSDSNFAWELLSRMPSPEDINNAIYFMANFYGYVSNENFSNLKRQKMQLAERIAQNKSELLPEFYKGLLLSLTNLLINYHDSLNPQIVKESIIKMLKDYPELNISAYGMQNIFSADKDFFWLCLENLPSFEAQLQLFQEIGNIYSDDIIDSTAEKIKFANHLQEHKPEFASSFKTGILSSLLFAKDYEPDQHKKDYAKGKITELIDSNFFPVGSVKLYDINNILAFSNKAIKYLTMLDKEDEAVILDSIFGYNHNFSLSFKDIFVDFAIVANYKLQPEKYSSLANMSQHLTAGDFQKSLDRIKDFQASNKELFDRFNYKHISQNTDLPATLEFFSDVVLKSENNRALINYLSMGREFSNPEGLAKLIALMNFARECFPETLSLQQPNLLNTFYNSAPEKVQNMRADTSRKDVIFQLGLPDADSKDELERYEAVMRPMISLLSDEELAMLPGAHYATLKHSPSHFGRELVDIVFDYLIGAENFSNANSDKTLLISANYAETLEHSPNSFGPELVDIVFEYLTEDQSELAGQDNSDAA